jgi:hypothetical protein
MDAALSREGKKEFSILSRRRSGGYNSEALLVYGFPACLSSAVEKYLGLSSLP